MKNFLLLLPLVLITTSKAQDNIRLSNPVVLDIMQGNYDPGNYEATNPISGKDALVDHLLRSVSVDSLKSYLKTLQSFKTRHTASDTTSSQTGIGAARRWIMKKFRQFSARNENRLIPSFLDFEAEICSVYNHRNVLSILPGMETKGSENILLMAHMDSRCSERCNDSCFAPGVDDNGSGTALVIELARIMSALSPDHSVIFMLTTGEEQGLWGAKAFADFAVDNYIPLKAVQNNDIVSNVLCGETSSPPGCPPGTTDSTHVRIYSRGKNNSPHKSYARFVKLQYQEELKDKLNVPVMIKIMENTDRQGRGGDHIAFSSRNLTAIRFTSAHEHGNGHPDSSYTDRQHTGNDILGVDLNNDNKIDSFFINLHYLKRNVLINGLGTAMASTGPEAPDFDLINDQNGLTVNITSQKQYDHYRIGVRTRKNYFDQLFTLKNGYTLNLPGIKKGSVYFISVASVDNEEIESLFSPEKFAFAKGDGPAGIKPGERNFSARLLRPQPNPFQKTTTIRISSSEPEQQAKLFIFGAGGKKIKTFELTLTWGITEKTLKNVIFPSPGVYHIKIELKNGNKQTKKLIYTGK